MLCDRWLICGHGWCCQACDVIVGVRVDRVGVVGRGRRRRKRRNRAGPGWWAEVDVPRGLYQVLLSGVGYLLMLSVM